MPRKSDADPMDSLEKLVVGLPTAEYALNVTVIYDEARSRKWAGDMYQRLESVLGSKSVRGTWWKLGDLREPGVLAGAVSKAIRADMIVVAVQSSEGLPLPFYYWVNAWLPHRPIAPGALVALLGQAVPRTTESGRLKKFLRAVAKRAHMDLLVTERITVCESQPELGNQAKI